MPSRLPTTQHATTTTIVDFYELPNNCYAEVHVPRRWGVHDARPAIIRSVHRASNTDPTFTVEEQHVANLIDAQSKQWLNVAPPATGVVTVPITAGRVMAAALHRRVLHDDEEDDQREAAQPARDAVTESTVDAVALLQGSTNDHNPPPYSLDFTPEVSVARLLDAIWSVRYRPLVMKQLEVRRQRAAKIAAANARRAHQKAARSGQVSPNASITSSTGFLPLLNSPNVNEQHLMMLLPLSNQALLLASAATSGGGGGVGAGAGSTTTAAELAVSPTSKPLFVPAVFTSTAAHQSTPILGASPSYGGGGGGGQGLGAASDSGATETNFDNCSFATDASGILRNLLVPVEQLVSLTFPLQHLRDRLRLVTNVSIRALLPDLKDLEEHVSYTPQLLLEETERDADDDGGQASHQGGGSGLQGHNEEEGVDAFGTDVRRRDEPPNSIRPTASLSAYMGREHVCRCVLDLVALCPNIQCLSIAGHHAPTETVQKVVEIIASQHPSLSQVDLRGNVIEVPVAKSLARALQSNPRVSILHLDKQCMLLPSTQKKLEALVEENRQKMRAVSTMRNEWTQTTLLPQPLPHDIATHLKL